MKIAVIGAGFGGLAAALDLLKANHEVTVFEAANKSGGLAVGFRGRRWNWSLEKYYHHVFTTDTDIIKLARDVGCPPNFSVPQTCIFRQDRISQLDSPLSLLASPELSLWGKLRLAKGLAVLKALPTPAAIQLERAAAGQLLPLIVGREGYQKIWQPLLAAKFGPYQNEINAAWFWARVAKRSTALGYFDGGFQALADALTAAIKTKGVEVKFNHQIKKISRNKTGVKIDQHKFDRVLLTVPAPLVNKLVGPLVVWPKINYLWGQTVVLELRRQFMAPYWLNILEAQWPFLVAVEHTNFVSPSRYANHHLVYFGNYLADGDQRLKLSDAALLKLYWPFLRQINPKLSRTDLAGCYRFQTPFAQPVFPVNYSAQLPPIATTDPCIFVANMSLVYPFDRGTNYAVELGQKAARLIAS